MHIIIDLLDPLKAAFDFGNNSAGVYTRKIGPTHTDGIDPENPVRAG
jgi:hypothetical protein